MRRLLSVILMFVLLACSSKPIYMLGTNLKVKEVYLQKTFPGMKNQKIKDYLHITLQEYSPSIELDSLYYLNKSFEIIHQRMGQQIDVLSGKAAQNQEFISEEKGSAVLFYHQDAQVFYYKIENIKRKESLYMP